MMRRLVRCLLLSTLAIFWLSSFSSSQDPKSLPVIPHYQETNDWCWAACAQMVMHYLGHNIEQCTQVNDYFGLKYCCLNKNKCSGYDFRASPQFYRYGFIFSENNNAPLSWEQIVNEINNNRPFCYGWAWTGGGYHMVCIIGYTIKGKDKHIEYIDPRKEYGKNILTYDAYVGCGKHSHSADFYGVKLRGK